MRRVFRAPGISLAAALAPATGVSREQMEKKRKGEEGKGRVSLGL